MVDKSYSLLKLEAGNRCVFFVVRDLQHLPDQGDMAYIYEEHDCPTNWLRNVVAVIEDGNADPHGFMEFVRSVPVPDALDEHQADWREIFPEAFAPCVGDK